MVFSIVTDLHAAGKFIPDTTDCDIRTWSKSLDRIVQTIPYLNRQTIRECCLQAIETAPQGCAYAPDRRGHSKDTKPTHCASVASQCGPMNEAWHFARQSITCHRSSPAGDRVSGC